MAHTDNGKMWQPVTESTKTITLLLAHRCQVLKWNTEICMPVTAKSTQ